MNSKRLHSALFACLPLALASPGFGFQIEPEVRQGPTSGLAFGLSLRGQGPETTLVKAPQAQTNPPIAWSVTQFPNSPDFSAAMMFPGIDALVWIDAHSTGNDVIPDLNTNGIPILTTNANWLGVVVSVKSGTNGKTGSLINRAKANGRISGADLFAYYYRESTGLASELAGTTLVSQTREMMGLGGNNTFDIDALDFGMGVRGFAQATPPSILFTNGVDYYFSITPDSADAINIHNNNQFALDGSGTPVPAHPADIYHLEWSTPTWGPVRVFRDHTDLLLTLPEDDIDGLAVDPASDNVVFSTQVLPGRSQLLVYHPTKGRFPLKETNGQRVTERIGGIDDVTDIDSICILDPTEYVGPPSHIGTPVANAPIPVGGSSMGLSVTRSQQSSPNAPSMLHCQLSGRRTGDAVESKVLFFYSTNFNTEAGWERATWMTLGTSDLETIQRTDEGSELDNVFDFSTPAPFAGIPHQGAVVALSFDVYDNLIGCSWIVEIGAP